ncbi:MAG: hypothetical protein RSH52_06605 [Janthinobacterium sp.]
MSNVVTLHVGDKEKEIELITSYQRSNIKLLVDKLASLTGDEDVKIYRGLITDYGLQRFKELPRSKYQEVKVTLEGRIDEAGKSFVDGRTTAVKSPPATAHHLQTALPCIACVEKTMSFIRLQRTARLQVAALIACLIACGWLLYKVQAPADHDVNPAKDGKCYIAGKAYTAGYIERSRGNAMECVGAVGDMPAMWLHANREQ